VANVMRMRSGSERAAGFTLLEMVIVLTILGILAAASYPLLRNTVKRERESELRESLRQIRKAIDDYKRFNDNSGGQAVPIQWRTKSGYPKTMEILVEGFIPANVVGTEGTKVRFLRRLPKDPMTGSDEWGMRASNDKPDSRSWSGEDLFDVYSKSDGTALDGTMYKDW
jgi:general secretion pathway protein G